MLDPRTADEQDVAQPAAIPPSGAAVGSAGAPAPPVAAPVRSRRGGMLAFVSLMLSGLGAVTWWRIWRTGREARADDARADALVVFGAAVWPSGPSPTLRVRTLAAAALFHRGVAPRVVCSGGHSGGRSEPEVMAELLRAAGVPAEAIVLDEAGVTTRATLASIVRLGGGTWRRIVAVSSPSHLLRIVEEARRRGITAIPAAARRPQPDELATKLRTVAWDARQYAREVVAVWAYRLPALHAALDRGVRPARLAEEIRLRWRSFVREADEVRGASEAIAAALRGRSASTDSQPGVVPRLAWPVEGRTTSRFAMRDGRLHEGIDIAQVVGTAVRPALPGVVVLAEELPGYGRVVVVQHTTELATVYAHLDEVDVALEDHVEPGRRLGTVGTSGRSFGAHLHFEVRFDGTPVDPLVFLP